LPQALNLLTHYLRRPDDAHLAAAQRVKIRQEL